MHRALSIDEIIRNILQCFSDSEKYVLARAARCCKTWRDPALDELWKRLTNMDPLLDLDGVLAQHAIQEPSSFSSYAWRVNHINLCRDPPAKLIACFSEASTTVLLPNLRSVRLSTVGLNEIVSFFALSTRLDSLEVDTSFKSKDSKNQWVPQYLELVSKMSPTLSCFRLRGFASFALNDKICQFCNVRVLSLRTGNSLHARTLAAVCMFPALEDLDLHAGSITPDDLDAARGDMHQQSSPHFPSLRRLHIRSMASTVEYLIRKLPANTLNTLNIDLDDMYITPAMLSAIFEAATAKLQDSLVDFSVEHHVDLNDRELGSPQLDSDPHHNAPPVSDPFIFPLDLRDHRISCAMLHPLSTLAHLHRLCIQTALPLSFTDDDAVNFAGWWPHLTHFDLGVFNNSSEQESLMSYNALEIFAARMPLLQTLILPLNLNSLERDGSGIASPDSPSNLNRLTVGSAVAPDTTQFCKFLSRVFPALVTVDGGGCHEVEWAIIQSAVTEQCRSDSDCITCT